MNITYLQANAEKVGRGRLEDLKKENFHWEWEPIAQEAQERAYYEEQENEENNGGLKERPRQARLTDTSSDTENYFFSSESQNKARKATKKSKDSEAKRDSSEDKVNPKRDRKLTSNFRGRITITSIFQFIILLLIMHPTVPTPITAPNLSTATPSPPMAHQFLSPIPPLMNHSTTPAPTPHITLSPITHTTLPNWPTPRNNLHQNVSLRHPVPEAVEMGSSSFCPTPRATAVMEPAYRSTLATRNLALLIVIGVPGDPGPTVP